MARQNYSNFVQLLKIRGFIELKHITRNDRSYFLANYGPPGTLLRQNVLKQWWKIMVLQQSNVFPVESPVFQATPSIKPSTSSFPLATGDINHRESLQQDCISKYLQVLKLTNGRLPVSIVTTGSCLSWREVQTDEPEEKVVLFGCSNLSRVLLQNYIPPTGASAVFDYWLQLRLSWWKKFSRHPANFSVTSSINTNSRSGGTGDSLTNSDGSKSNNNHNNNQSPYKMYITYEFPWGPEPVEEITNLGDKHLARLQEDGDQSYKGKTAGNKSCLPHCIECSSNIEAATAAWLIDSFHERRPYSEAKKQGSLNTSSVLQLHPHIAPYQVAIIMSLPAPSSSSSSASSSLEMRHICDKLERDFQAAGISVFNTSLHGSVLEAHLKRNDQLGIPYTVIVTDVTLTEGVIKTRHRDTGIQSESHISSIVDSMSRNLQAKLEATE